MSDFDDLDGLFGQLRSDATPAELADEERVLTLMASNHSSAKGTPMFTSRRIRVATFIAAGVIGFGGVAAAGPGSFDFGSLEHEDDAPSTSEPEDETTTTSEPEDEAPATSEPDDETPATSEPEDETSPETTAADSDDAAVVYGELEDPNPDTVFNEAYCEEGSHGRTVSAVAKGEPPFEDVDAVDAAHSDCGKTGDDATDGDDSGTEDDEGDGGAGDEEGEGDSVESQGTETLGRPDDSGRSRKDNTVNRRDDNGNRNGQNRGDD